MSEPRASQTSQIKLLVNTASEAVELLRERYGDKAKVLSVRQVEAEGLRRLISKPRLEVIVEVPAGAVAEPKAGSPAKPAPAAETPKASQPQPKAQPKTEEASAAASKQPIAGLYAKKSEPATDGGYFADFDPPAPKPSRQATAESEDGDAPLGSAANPVKRGTLEAVSRAIGMLEAVGFDRTLIERMRAEIDFKDIGSLPTMDLYARICDWLRRRFPAGPAKPLGATRAFVGTCGSGKTAALCKTLSADVFINGLTPTVLKVDSELPNPSDALEIFCEIMGAGLARSRDEIETVSESQPLLVDMPGYLLRDQRSIDECAQTLDDLGIEERILVVNAAYDAEAIGDQLAAGERVRATRVVFSHLDEARRSGKLWRFLLNGRITPLFFSEGPNPAGDYVLDTYSYLLERSFPNGRELAAATKRQESNRISRPAKEASLSK